MIRSPRVHIQIARAPPEPMITLNPDITVASYTQCPCDMTLSRELQCCANAQTMDAFDQHNGHSGKN